MLLCEEATHRRCGCLGLGRRAMLGGLATGVAAAFGHRSQAAVPTPAEIKAVPALGRTAPASIARVRRIDVHHHPVPPAYVEAVAQTSGLIPPLRNWSPETSLADMDRAGVETAMLSVPGSGLWLPDPATNRRVARACNEYMAGMVAKYPGRFGFWAALPLPDMEASQAEAAYALDTLHADGVGLFTNYGSKWLGDASFAPLFAELDRRGTVVFTHPNTPNCCGGLIANVPEATIEYGTDTARAIASLLFSGTAGRTPNVKLIFSHAGGTMPTLIERFVLLSRQASLAPITPNGVLDQIRRFFYDTAQSANPEALGPLLQIVPLRQLVFGTDFPYRTSIEYIAALDGCGLSEQQLGDIGRANSLDLVPRLA